MAKKRAPRGLIQFDGSAVARPASAQDVEPKWNQLFVLGTFKRGDFPGGELKIDLAFCEAMVRNWKKMGGAAKPIDSLHRGDSGEDGLPAEEKAARGWIEDLQVRADGLWGLVRWNAKGLAFVLGDEYRYLSPSFHPDWVDSRTGKRQGPTLFGAGLLNNPFLEELPRVAASAVTGDEPEENTVNKKLLCARLGIPEDSTDEAINAALAKPADGDALKLANEKAAKDAEALKLAQDSAATLKAEALKLSERVKSLEQDKADAAIAALCTKLEGEGRIIAADKERVAKLVASMGLKDATEFAASWPVKVALGENGISGNNKDTDSPETAAAKLDALVNDEMTKARAAGLQLSARDALNRVKAAHRELATRAFTVTKPAEA